MREKHLPDAVVVSLICPTCGVTFERRRNQTHLVKKKNKTTYCSRYCVGRGTALKGMKHIDWEDQVWCTGCQKYCNRNLFSAGRRANGLDYYCRGCKTSKMKRYRQAKADGKN